MKFTNKEINKLNQLGFEKNASAYSYELANGVIILTVEKTDTNEFTLYNDNADTETCNFIHTGQTFKNLVKNIKECF